MNPLPSYIVAFTLLLSSGLQATEFYVNKTGRDAHPGTTRETAFLTVQRGLDALLPGDTLLVGPGEYNESATRKGLGDATAETVIKAEISGTVLLRGDVDAPEFTRVPGLQQTHRTKFGQTVHAVYEVDTLSRLGECATLAEVEFQPGSFFFDPATGDLYISSTDLKPADSHRYSIPVLGKAGFCLEKPVRVVLEGIAVRGFESQAMADSRTLFGTWGIVLLGPRDCVVRDCTAFLKGGGICIASEGEGGNLVERCRGYGNSSPHNSSECAGVLLYQSRNDIARDCVAYRSIGVGIRIYGLSAENGRLERCLGWGNGGPDVGIKSGRAETCATTHSIGLGYFAARNVSHSILGGQNIYVPDADLSTDNIRLNAGRLPQDREFADPRNFDFRLQSTSSIRGTAPDGKDRGPFPYLANVFFVTPAGNDAADGLSVANAWKTAARAAQNLRPGDTVYFEEGVYSGPVIIHSGKLGAESVSLRARGSGEVVFNGSIRVEHSCGVEFERLWFTGPVDAVASEQLRFHNCHFVSKRGLPSSVPDPEIPSGEIRNSLTANKVRGLSVTHCEFTGSGGPALSLEDCRQCFLASNIYDNHGTSAVEIRGENTEQEPVQYSDYNSYSDPSLAWKLATRICSLNQLGERHDQYSHAIRAVYVSTKKSAHLSNPVSFRGLGALGQNIGFHQDRPSHTLDMTRPAVHSVGTTTANIEWLVTRGAECDLAWGDTPECVNRVKFHVGVTTDNHRSYSLTGLLPGKTYYFRVAGLSAANPYDGKGKPEVPNPQYGTVSFTTDGTQRAATTFYVAPDGDDSHPGLERAHAWRTVGHAASQVRAGDTVLIAGGTYLEKVRVRVSGDGGMPIRFKSLPGEKVVFDGNQRRVDAAWIINGKTNIELDGLYFRQVGMQGGGNSGSRVINVSHSTDVRIKRCLWDGYGKGYAPGFVCAWHSRNLHISNCVIARGFDGLEVTDCPGFLLENNVFVGNLIQANKLATAATVRHNIFCDSIPSKVKVPLQQYGTQREIKDLNNCYFLRASDAERQLFWVLNFSDENQKPSHTRMSLEDYNRRVGPTGSVIGDPQFAATLKLDPARVAPFPVDSLPAPIDFPDVFATNPEIVTRGIGLQQEAFADMIPK
jgi:hypothetical protein